MEGKWRKRKTASWHMRLQLSGVGLPSSWDVLGCAASSVCNGFFWATVVGYEYLVTVRRKICITCHCNCDVA